MGRCEFCKRPTVKNKENVSFHRFPVDPKRMQIWVQNMGRTGWVPRKHSVLCSDHFASDCFEYAWKRTKLKKTSVPTIFGKRIVRMSEMPLQLEKPVIVNTDIFTCSSKNIIALPSPNVTKSHSTSALSTPAPKSLKITHKIQIGKKNSSVTSVPAIARNELLVLKEKQKHIRHDHHYAETSQSNHMKILALQAKLSSSQKANKTLKQQVKRLKLTVNSLKNLIRQFNKRNKLDTH